MLFKKNKAKSNSIKMEHYNSPIEFARAMAENTVKHIPNTPENNPIIADVIALTVVAMEDYKDELKWING